MIVFLYSIFLTCTMISFTNKQEEKSKYLALGDSYTIGESVEFAERFPVQLVHKLKFKGHEFAYPDIIAKTGWTTDELMAAIDQEDPSTDYDLVTLLIGVNNQYRGRDLENYKKEFEELLTQAISFAGGKKDRVSVISIPDYGVTPFGQQKGRKKIAKAIDQFNAANLTITDQYEVAYVDVTEISRKAYRRVNLIASDGLHPSGEMYGMWVEAILPVASKLLEN